MTTWVFDFFHNENVFSLGVCNGCQTFSLLKSLIPGATNWPVFKRNKSEKFEARLVQVSVRESPSIFFKDMGDSIITVPVAHGEGRVDASMTVISELNKNHHTTITYSNNKGELTEEYPANPNGSLNGIAGVTNNSGTVTIMMPHPERVFRKVQLSWHRKDWNEYSPWMQIFINAKKFSDKN